MGNLLLWVGLTLIMAIPKVIPQFVLSAPVGAVIMIIGCILLALKK